MICNFLCNRGYFQCFPCTHADTCEHCNKEFVGNPLFVICQVQTVWNRLNEYYMRKTIIICQIHAWCIYERNDIWQIYIQCRKKMKIKVDVLRALTTFTPNIIYHIDNNHLFQARQDIKKRWAIFISYDSRYRDSNESSCGKMSFEIYFQVVNNGIFDRSIDKLFSVFNSHLWSFFFE